jgi:hypothetical protein
LGELIVWDGEIQQDVEQRQSLHPFGRVVFDFAFQQPDLFAQRCSRIYIKEG